MNVPFLQINNDICLHDEFHKMWHTKRQDTLKSEMWANNLQHKKKKKEVHLFQIRTQNAGRERHRAEVG